MDNKNGIENLTRYDNSLLVCAYSGDFIFDSVEQLLCFQRGIVDSSECIVRDRPMMDSCYAFYNASFCTSKYSSLIPFDSIYKDEYYEEGSQWISGRDMTNSFVSCYIQDTIIVCRYCLDGTTHEVVLNMLDTPPVRKHNGMYYYPEFHLIEDSIQWVDNMIYNGCKCMITENLVMLYNYPRDVLIILDAEGTISTFTLESELRASLEVDSAVIDEVLIADDGNSIYTIVDAGICELVRINPVRIDSGAYALAIGSIGTIPVQPKGGKMEVFDDRVIVLDGWYDLWTIKIPVVDNS